MAETRRKFDHDFREGAVRLARETGKPIAGVTRDPFQPPRPPGCCRPVANPDQDDLHAAVSAAGPAGRRAEPAFRAV
jgi:hypothetical protein